MGNNECQHQWVKTPYGYQCLKCPQMILNEQVIAIPGIIYEDTDLEDEDNTNKENEDQSK